MRASLLTQADIDAITSTIVVPHRFDTEQHGDACAALAVKVRERDGAYPPAVVPSSRAAISEWLSDEQYLSRVVVTANSQVVGHVGLVQPHEYLLSRLPHADLPWVEVTKLFADPEHRRLGVGTILLENAQSEAGRLGLRAALAVMGATPAAVALYRRLGWSEVTSFVGRDGLNLVFADLGGTTGSASMLSTRSRV